MSAGKNHSSASYVVNCYREFAELPDAVLDRLSHRNVVDFFYSIDWFSCLAQSGFSERPHLRLLVCHDQRHDDRIPYLLCLRTDAGRKRLTGLSNYYTIKFPGVTGPGTTCGHVLSAIVNVIASERPAWTEIELRYLSASDPATARLSALFASAGYKVSFSHQYWNWYVNVDGISYASYLADRPARLQNTLHRQANKVARSHAVRFEDYSEANHLAAGLADYLYVYERSWKRQENPQNFVPELIRLCASLDILRLGVLYLDDTPVAAQLWIISNRVSFIYKLAHDPQYDAFSVGSLLTAHMFEQAIDVDKVSEIDFGVGDEAYKRDWTDERRQLVGLQAINRRTLRGSLLSLRLSIRDALRRVGLRRYMSVRLNTSE